MNAENQPRIHIRLSERYTEAELVFDAGLAPTDLDPLALNALLDERGLARTAQRDERLARAVEQYLKDPGRQQRFLVMEGVHPRHGRDETLELDLPQASRPPQPSADATPGAAIDQHARSTIHAVRAGQRIGRVTARTDPVDGTDVLGHAVPAHEGKRLRQVIDETIRRDGDGTLCAIAGGIVELTDARLRIVTDLTIAGNIDFSTGNVEFPGNVTVEHGVRDCFRVSVGGSLRVTGLVEAAHLDAGEDAFLVRGMAARGQGSLKVGRDLAAHYLSDVRCDVGRDASIDKELANCTMSVRRRFKGPECTLVRGELCVAAGCELGTIGSDAGVRTNLVLGRIFDLEERARKAILLIPKIQERLEESSRRYAAMNTGGRLPREQAEELAAVQRLVQSDHALLKRAGETLGSLLVFLSKSTSATLTTHHTVHPGAHLWMGPYLVEVTRPIPGPLWIRLDARGEPVLTQPGNKSTPAALTDFARVTADDRFVDVGGMVKSLGLAGPILMGLAA